MTATLPLSVTFSKDTPACRVENVTLTGAGQGVVR